MVISVNTQCMLKAGLSLFSEKEYELFKDKMFKEAFKLQ